MIVEKVKMKFMTLEKGSMLWLFMSLVLITAPVFPGQGSFGFYSIEWSFFVGAAAFMFVTILYWLYSTQLHIIYDKFYLFMGFFILLCLFSVIDAPSKFKAILKVGQYVPYFFIAGVAINTIDDEHKLNKLFRYLIWLSVLFSVYVIVVALLYQSRSTLNEFLLNTVNLDTAKVFPFILFAYSYCLQQILQCNRVFFCRLLFVAIMTGAVIVSGSRGGLGGLALLIIWTIITQKQIRLRKKIFIMSFMGICCAIFLLSANYSAERYYKNLSGQVDITAFSRIYTAMIAVIVMKDHPINGVGMGNLSSATEDALNESKLIPNEIVEYWKNRVIFETTTMPLKLGAELGVVGFLFFFLFYWYMWNRINYSVDENINKNLRIVLASLRVSIFVSFAHNFIDTAFSNYYTWLYYGLTIAATRVSRLGYRSIKK